MLFRLIVVEMSCRVVISHINQDSSGYAITQISVAEHNTVLFLTSVKSTMGLVDSIQHSATQYTMLFYPFDIVTLMASLRARRI